MSKRSHQGQPTRLFKQGYVPWFKQGLWQVVEVFLVAVLNAVVVLRHSR